MEQEMNNMSNNEPVGASQATEQMAAEQVTVAEMGPAPAMPEAPKKKSNGMLIGLILCLLVAAGGVGFGVFAMMDGSAQKESLNKQISELKKTNNDLMDKLNNTTVVDDDTIIDVNTDSDVNTEDYIYMGEWGVKIKIPENLNVVSYSINDYEHDWRGGSSTSLCITANTEGHGDVEPSFIMRDGYFNELGCVKKYSSVEENLADVDGDSIEVGKYYFEGPQSIIGDGTDTDWETESIQAIKAMLSTDNMSAI